MRTHAKALASGEELHQPAQPTKAPETVQPTDACNKELPALISQQQLMVVTTAPKPLPPTNAMETEDASSRTINAER
jgi:hypothetical protein